MNNIPANIQSLINKAYITIRDNNPEWYVFITDIKWESNNRLRRVLGRACMSKIHSIYKIELSQPFIESAKEEVIYETIIHEIAHIIAYRKYNDGGHGRYWKIVYMNLGGNGNVTTSVNETGYKIKRNKIKRVIVEKAGIEYRVTLNKYNNFKDAYTNAGYMYRRTIMIDSNGTIKTIHSYKEVGIDSIMAAQVSV